jgi:hypothetical protein
VIRSSLVPIKKFDNDPTLKSLAVIKIQTHSVVMFNVGPFGPSIGSLLLFVGPFGSSLVFLLAVFVPITCFITTCSHRQRL